MYNLNLNVIRKNFALFGITLLLIGIFFSPALISISLIFILIQPFIVYSPKEVFQKLIKSKLALLLIVMYIVELLGGFYSEDMSQYLATIRIKLPFILLPIGLIYDGLYNRKNLIYIFALLNVLVFVTGASSFVNYLLHSEEINQSILHSKEIPIITGINHIYFSFILAFSIISGFILVIEFLEDKKLKIICFVIVFCNLLFLHIIAARTGLVAFYGAIFIILIFWGIVTRKYIWMIGIMAFFCISLFLSVNYIGSLNNRYRNTMEDITIYMKGGDINYWSISMRLEAWKKSILVFKSSPIIGVANADVQQEIRKRFADAGTVLMVENQKGTHNQYLKILAGSGIIGFLIFILILLLPIIKVFRYKDYLLMALLTVILLTFCIESILERQIGVTFFILFLAYLDRPIESFRKI